MISTDCRTEEFLRRFKDAMTTIKDTGSAIDSGGFVGEAYDGSRDFWIKYRGDEYFITVKKANPKLSERFSSDDQIDSD